MRASVIIPAYNACERLYYNLIALNNQNYPSNEFEVIVINNGSSDKTAKMLSQFHANYRLLTITLVKNRGIAYARNKGILKAVGEILIFHDSDMIATRDFIKNHTEAHEDTNMVVCGSCWRRVYSYYYKNFRGYLMENFNKIKYKYNIKNQYLNNRDKQRLLTKEQILDGSFIDYSFDLNMPFIFSLKQVIEKHGEELVGYNFPWRFFITNNCSVYKENIMNVGLFDQKIKRYGFEDYDLGIRLHKFGCKYIFKDNIISVHQEHPTNYTRDDVWYNLYYMCEKYNSPHFVDMLLVCSNMCRVIDQSLMNDIMNDIKQISQIDKYKELIEVFITLLKVLRNRYYKKDVPNGKKIILQYKKSEPNFNIDLQKIQEQGKEIYEELGLSHFIESLYTLIKDVYDIDLINVSL